jgi:hypothetical protein
MKLWKYNKVTGYWGLVRECSADTADRWLAIFQADDPDGVYKVSKARPKEQAT